MTFCKNCIKGIIKRYWHVFAICIACNFHNINGKVSVFLRLLSISVITLNAMLVIERKNDYLFYTIFRQDNNIPRHFPEGCYR